MLDNIYIIDFNDSFTYNIASVLNTLGFDALVVNHQDFFSNTIDTFQSLNYKVAIILGPGPGHPNQYQKYFDAIRVLDKNKNIYLMGICLGHQILGLVDGLTVKEANEKRHGIQVDLSIFSLGRKVQYYNSLAVFKDNIQVDIRKRPNGISYQFHPESIGTDDNKYYFLELVKFIES